MPKPTIFHDSPNLKQYVEYGRRLAVLDRWVDGDSCYVWIDIGYDVYSYVELRIAGLLCPELSDPSGKGKASLSAAILFIQPGTNVLVESLYRRSFNRYIANVDYINIDSTILVSFAESMIKSNNGASDPRSLASIID